MKAEEKNKLHQALESGDKTSHRQSVGPQETSTREFLCFLLGKENYGIEAHQVKEIIPDQVITQVPCTPDYILGAIYFRGQILPILNLKMLMNLPAEPFQAQSRFLIVEANGISAGIKADRVSEITLIPTDKVQPPLSVLDKIKSDFLLGEVLLENQLIILLNLEKIIEGARIQGRKPTTA